jgi:hypothetical protein
MTNHKTLETNLAKAFIKSIVVLWFLTQIEELKIKFGLTCLAMMVLFVECKSFPKLYYLNWSYYISKSIVRKKVKVDYDIISLAIKKSD